MRLVGPSLPASGSLGHGAYSKRVASIEARTGQLDTTPNWVYLIDMARRSF